MTRRLSLVELLASALCLWAAWYHTPAGALLRSAGARVFGVRTASSCRCGSGGGVGAGWSCRPNRAKSRASMRSVLANWPVARAKSRARRGFKTLTAKPA